MKIPSGIPTTADYNSILNCDDFRLLESFSNGFLQRNREIFKEYGRKWISDPFHAYNRQWEYPYVYQQIQDCVQGNIKPGQRIRILDAGSGVTFFPFFLADKIPNAAITCCDYDLAIQRLFNRIKRENRVMSFNVEDLRALTFANDSFHVAYRISVMEHTHEYEKIVFEFSRILAPGGLLIVTFDVSLDGQADIPAEEAARLLKVINDKFAPVAAHDGEKFLEAVQKPGIVSTAYIKKFNRQLLPWRHPFLSLLKSALMKKYIPHSLMKNLTFYYGSLIRRER